MRWDLLFSDLFARILGFVGLVAAIPFFAHAVNGGGFVRSNISIQSACIMGGVTLLVALLFLLPRPFEATLRISRSWVLRPGFFMFCLLWLVLVAGGLSELKTLAGNFGLTAAPFQITTLVFIVTFLVLVFPLGYGWRAYRDVHEAHEAQLVQKRAERLAASVVPGSERLTNGMSLRKQDFLDNLMFLPLGALMLLGFYGFKVSSTVQTSEWDQWADENWILGSVIVGGIIIGPSILMNLIRGMPYNPRAMQSKWGRRILATIIMPPLGYLCYLVAAYDALPAAWNLINQAERSTLQYQVLRVTDARRLRDCMQLQLVEDPERRMFVCNVSGELVRDLRPGEIIEATGPLSEYGHSFEQVRIVQ